MSNGFGSSFAAVLKANAMNKRQLSQLLDHLRAAKNGANWQGKFTPEIREATVAHRAEYIAKPIDICIGIVTAELKQAPKVKPKNHRAYRTPYKDN